MPDTPPAPVPPPAPPPPGRSWGPDLPTPPGRGRRKALLAVLVALVALAGVTLGLLYWFAPPLPLAALPVWVTTEPGSAGPVPWAAQDRAALLAGDPLGRPLDDPAANPTRDQLRLRFRALQRVRRSQPVVVHVAAPASVDATGGVYLLPADPLGDHPRNRLPLAELLGYFRDCPARHKLLVLNLSPPPDDPRFAPPPGDLASAVMRSLEESPDPARLCLVACGPGQAPLASPDLGRSVFAYYLEAGLRGLADGWGPDGDRDGRVTPTELAAFVRGRVGRWAGANLRPAQTPVLVGTAADFTLATYPLSDPPGAPEVAGGSVAYPDWLRAGWERHDRWLADGRANAAPRALALLRDALLAAERDLLGGRSAGDVQQALDRRLGELDRLAAALTAVAAPTPLPTLATLFPGYVSPDPALRDALDDATRIEPPPPPAPAKPDEKPAAAGPVLPPTLEPFLKKPHAEVALAAFRVLADDPAPTAGRVRRVALLLATQEPSPKFAETLLIQRLADLADPAAGVTWVQGRAALALQTARLLEEAAARPEVVAWARPALDEAYQLRADAEAVLFAPGYANPADADRRLRAAAEAARGLKANADQLRAALAARDEAAAWLAGATPVVDADLVPLADAVRLADQTRQLVDALAPPEKPVDAAGFAELARTWRDREAAVRATLNSVSVPLRPAALARLRGRVEGGDAGPAVLVEVNAVLFTPLVPAAERATLWNARASLTRRLNDDALRKDAADDDAVRRRLASPEALDPREPVTASANAERATRRAAWTAALLRAGGAPVEAVTATETELTRLAADPPAFSARLRKLWLEDVPNLLTKDVQLARVAPVVPGTAFLDQPDRNPATLLARDRARKLWAWQAARFDYEARDSDTPFARAAARASAAVAGPPADPYLELTIPAKEPALTPEKPVADVRVHLRLIGPADPRPVVARVLSPDDEWVTAGGGGQSNLGPIREQTVAFAVAAGPRPTAHPRLKGVLVEAEVAGRTYHRRVPVSLDAIVNRLDLFTRTDPTEAPRPVRTIALRPHGIPQPIQLLLSNPTAKPRIVVARLVGFDRVTAPLTVEPGKFVALKFPAPPPPPAPAVAPPPPTAAPAAPAEPVFDPLKGPLVVELIDPADPEKVVQRFTVSVQVLDPAAYLKAEEATFRPAGTRPNRLGVRVVPDAVPPGPPVQVVVSLPPLRNPDVLQVRDANLSGPLPADNSPLTLYAENVSFANPGGGKLVVTVAADGVERAFTYAGEVSATGGTVRLARLTQPMVRVARAPGEWYALPAQPLPVPVEVDNAPDGATIELRLGTGSGASFVTDVALVVDPAKERFAGVRFDPKGETLLLRGTLRDPLPALPVGLLVGERTLEARLLDANGDELAASSTTVIFDGTPPTRVELIDPPPQAGKGQPLTVRATCDPTVSGIKEVLFFVGKPDEKQNPPKTPVPVPGVLIDPRANVWQAVLQPGKDADRVTIGVQFTTRSGRSSVATADVELLDPAVLARPKPGKIVGKLVEAGIAQGDHPVFLYDEKRNPLAKATTKKDGTFEFADVPPGKYSLYAIHVDTNREVLTDVLVAPGATTKQDLEMFLRATPQ
jgi:hypothetical protein